MEEIIKTYGAAATRPIISSAQKVLDGNVLLPNIDLSSHKELYTLIQCLRTIGTADETIYLSFRGWTENSRWIELQNPEYIYKVWLLMEELVDFRKYFRLARKPWDTVLSAIQLAKELHVDCEEYIGMIKYFSEFNIELCFEMNNDKVQADIARLYEEYTDARDHFLIDVHHYHQFFTYVGTGAERWKCDGFSLVARPHVGENVVVDADTALARLHEFSCGVSLGPQFPWENVAIAGGCISKIIGADYDKKNARQSDFDIFPFGRTFEERSAVFNKLIDYFRDSFGARAYYAINASVVSIYIKGINRKFQIISSNATSVWSVISKFDMTHVQIAYWNGRFYCTPLAAIAMREKLTRLSNTHSVKAYRLVKALTCGYDVETSKNIIDITPLVEDPKSEQVQSILRGLHEYYYPTDMPGYDPEEELKHILAMISKDSNASMVTNDHQYVRQNIIVSGDFGSSYESTSFTTFNPALICNNNRRGRVQLRTRRGALRLSSEFMTVAKVISGEAGISLTLSAPDDKFPEFTRVLEGNVFRMIHGRDVTKKIFNDDSRDMTVIIPRHVINAQASRGFSCIRNQRGIALNIEEDLALGDKIQFMFYVELFAGGDVRTVTLKPLKFIKYDITQGPQVETNDDIDAGTAETGEDPSTEINYIEY